MILSLVCVLCVSLIQKVSLFQSGPPLTTEMYGQIHSHREGSPAGSGRICYEVRHPGRVGTDDLNVFPYFSSTRPGDGGLAVLPGESRGVDVSSRPTHRSATHRKP